MSSQATESSIADRELLITRLINASPEKVYRAWTEPELLRQWNAPFPWQVVRAEIDLRPGGTSLVVMRGPEGNELPNRGVYLEVVPNEKLVFTDAYTEAWVPSEKPFMTVILTFEKEGSKTRYTARVRHFSVAVREAHERMGFYQGWGQCTTQLEKLVATL